MNLFFSLSFSLVSSVFVSSIGQNTNTHTHTHSRPKIFNNKIALCQIVNKLHFVRYALHSKRVILWVARIIRRRSHYHWFSCSAIIYLSYEWEFLKLCHRDFIGNTLCSQPNCKKQYAYSWERMYVCVFKSVSLFVCVSTVYLIRGKTWFTSFCLDLNNIRPSHNIWIEHILYKSVKASEMCGCARH